MYSQNNRARDGDKDTSKAKTLRPTIINNMQSLTQFYLQDTVPPTFIQKKRKGYPQRQGRQTGSVDLYGVEPG